ncbi:arylsulfatase [Mycobacteroides abscessus]|nr:arylsulfatase [Mycobacteroides abscessus]
MDFDVSECADGVFVDEQHVPAMGAALFEDDTLRCRFRGDFGEDRKGLAANLNHRTRPTAALLG